MSAMPDAGTLDARPFAGTAGDGMSAGRHTVGPNAIIQTLAALDEIVGIGRRRAIFGTSGHGAFADHNPDGMVEARIVNGLNYEIAARLDPETAHAVMKRAGEMTGDYILANRIPKPAQWLLRRLPRALAQRLLMAAIVGLGAAGGWGPSPHLGLVAIMALAVAFLSASQDIIIAIVIDILYFQRLPQSIV